jgi:hypothetical protein
MRRVGIFSVLLATGALALPGAALAAAPANDDIAAATGVTAVPFADGPYDTTEATTGATDPSFCFEPGASPDRSTVWYSFTPGSSGRYIADTFGSDYDTTLYVGTLNAAGGIDGIACNDDTVDLQSAVVWQAEAGTTYLLMVGTCCGGGVVGQGGGGGLLEFHLDVAPPPPTIDLTVDGRGSFTQSGTAIIRGTVACTGVLFGGGGEGGGVVIQDTTGGMISVDLRQRVGRLVIRGFGSGFDGPCSGEPVAWSIEVTGDNGTFAGGNADATVLASGCGPVECVEVAVSRTIRLRR